MIAHLKGVLTEKAAGRLVVDVSGVGYEVVIPYSTYYELGEVGDTVSLHIYTHVKEDAFSLYGFSTSREKRLFTQLIQISGIGPKLGVTILSGLPVSEFVEAVTDENVVKLNEIPGVGKKTAERLVLEMKDKVLEWFPQLEEAQAGSVSGSLQGDVISALVNLGYPKHTAERAVARARQEVEGDSFEALLRESLRKVRK
jgi:Holliday junction DNA helicase RuvA